MHLTSDELEARDLIFRLAVGPGRSDCRPNRRFIPSDAAGARGNETGACALVEVSPASAFCRTIKWNSVIISRASAKVSTPASVTATLRVYAFVSKSRPIIMWRTISGRRNLLKVLCAGLFSPPSATRPLLSLGNHGPLGAKVQPRFDSRTPTDRRAMAGADRVSSAGYGRHSWHSPRIICRT